MNTMFACAVILGCLSFAAAHCPNMCSGHGSCGPDDVCTCYNGFTFPDCSARLCRESTAWFARRDKTLTGHSGSYNYEAWTTVTTAHGLETECSNAGLCDRKTGQCKCFNGWTGTACERTLCPGGMNCNGHGTCESIREQNVLTKLHADYGYFNDDAAWIADFSGSDGTDGNQVSSTDRDQSYDGDAEYIDADYVDGGDTDHWDADKIVGCNCDFGWTGFDCSYRLCPRGDDPIYVRSTLEETTFTFDNDDAIITPLKYSFKYYGKNTDSITFYSAAATETNVMAEERISEVLHRHPYIKDVTVEVTFETADISSVQTHTGMVVKIVFNQIHSQIFLIDGTEEDDTSFDPRDITLNLELDSALVPGTAAAGLTAPFGGASTTDGAYQHMECSMRGMCDSSTGLCKCFEGYTGDACEIQSSLAF